MGSVGCRLVLRSAPWALVLCTIFFYSTFQSQKHVGQILLLHSCSCSSVLPVLVAFSKAPKLSKYLQSDVPFRLIRWSHGTREKHRRFPWLNSTGTCNQNEWGCLGRGKEKRMFEPCNALGNKVSCKSGGHQSACEHLPQPLSCLEHLVGLTVSCLVTLPCNQLQPPVSRKSAIDTTAESPPPEELGPIR